MTKYKYYDLDAILQTTESRIKANNEAYHSGSVVTAYRKGRIIETFTPYRIMLTSDESFHIHELRNQ